MKTEQSNCIKCNALFNPLWLNGLKKHSRVCATCGMKGLDELMKECEPSMEIDWTHADDPEGIILGSIHGHPGTTLFLIYVNMENPERGRLSGAFIPDGQERMEFLQNGLIPFLKTCATRFFKDWMEEVARPIFDKQLDDEITPFLKDKTPATPEQSESLKRIKKGMAKHGFTQLTDDERMEIMGDYCRYCGCNSPSCQCSNDE